MRIYHIFIWFRHNYQPPLPDSCNRNAGISSTLQTETRISNLAQSFGSAQQLRKAKKNSHTYTENETISEPRKSPPRKHSPCLAITFLMISSCLPFSCRCVSPLYNPNFVWRISKMPFPRAWLTHVSCFPWSDTNACPAVIPDFSHFVQSSFDRDMMLWLLKHKYKR